jgi:glycosyltransferase involved in cell wall biosynthesis
MDKTEKVSVIIPTYKGSRTIERAINSVIIQDYPDIEIIIVDDNPVGLSEQEETESIIHSIQQTRPMIYINHVEHMNGSAARNTGVESASGKYICFLDDDDYFLPCRITSLVECQRKHCSDAVFSYVKAEKNGEVYRLIKTEFSSNPFLDVFLNENIIGTGSNLFMTRDAYYKAGGFDEKLNRNQDYDFLLSFFSSKLTASVIKEFLVVKDDSFSRNMPKYEDCVWIKEYIYRKYLCCINDKHDLALVKRYTHRLLLKNAMENEDINGIKKEMVALDYRLSVKEWIEFLLYRLKMYHKGIYLYSCIRSVRIRLFGVKK